MSSHPAPTPAQIGGNETDAARAVIAWTEEEALRHGEIGLRDGYTDQEVLDLYTLGHSNLNFDKWPEPADDESAFVAATEELHDETRQMQHRQKLMREWPASIIERANDIVDKELEALRPIAKQNDQLTLREKVVKLYKLKYPEPKSTTHVTIWIKPPPEVAIKSLIQKNLRLSTPFDDLDAALRDLINYEIMYQAPGLKLFSPVCEEGRSWKYQLANPNSTSLIKPASTKIGNETAYVEMTKTISMPGGPTAILTQDTKTEPAATGSPSATTDGRKAEFHGEVGMGDSDDYNPWDNHNEILDMDGKPFFDPPTRENKKRMRAAVAKKQSENGQDAFGRFSQEDMAELEAMNIRDFGVEPQ